jgi:APA family basic amino acid/polyamine antiporter
VSPSSEAFRSEPAPALRRVLRLPQATALVVGTIIGASIFVQPSEITTLIPSPGGVIVVWVLAGVLTLFGALVCAELASAYGETGGVYVFLREAFSPAFGFLWGWAMFWSIHSGIIAAIAVVLARYVAFFWPMGDEGIRLTAVAAIAVVSAVNYVGVRAGSLVQTGITAAKVVAIAVMLAAAFAMTPPERAAALPAGAAWADFTPRDVMLGLIAGLFAFGGWHMVTYAAGETVEPRRTVPLALLVGTAIVTACYVGLNAAYLRVLPLEAVRSSTRVAADAADALLGGGGAAAVSALVVLSTFGSLTGIVLAGPRVYYSMAQDGLLFRWAGAVHPRFRTPHRAIALQAVWSAVLVLTGTYRVLFTRVIYTEWAFFGLMAAGLVVLRRRPDYAPAAPVWGYPAVPIVFMAASAAIVIHQIVVDPVESLFGLCLVALGFPVYGAWIRRTRRAAEEGDARAHR